MQKKYYISAIAVAAIGVFATITYADSQKDVLAKIGNEKITLDEYNTTIMALGMPKSDGVEGDLLNQLIEQKLLSGAADKAGLEKREDVQSKIAIMKDMILRDAYLAQFIEENLSDDVLKAEHEKRIEGYEPPFEYRAAHILVDDKAKIDEIAAELKSGKEFSELAKEFSKDSSAANGGDLGYFLKEMMVEPFGDAVEALEVGEYSDPVKTDFGWHVIKLNEKRKKEIPSFDKVKTRLEAEMAQKLVTEHIEKLKDAADVKVYHEDEEESDKESS